MKRDYGEDFKKVFVESGISVPADVLNKLKSDPSLLGLLIAQLINERRRMNALLEQILDRLDRIEATSFPSPHPQRSSQGRRQFDTDLLPESDRKILSIISSLGGRATAEDVRKVMGYKGRNAASARLNRLFSMGILDKKHVGKKVYFMLKGEATG